MNMHEYINVHNHRFHEVRALRTLMHAARTLRENGDYVPGQAPNYYKGFLGTYEYS